MDIVFIRRTQTRRTQDGKPYFSHRLVHSERVGDAVRQRTLLNLGRHFDIPQAQWPQLCARIDDILAGQAPLVADCPHAVEHEAQRIASQLVVRGPQVSGAAPGPTDVQPLDVDSLRLVRPRSVGVEQLGLWALDQLGLPALLADLGVNGALRAAAAGVIVGRLAHPASERATHRWLQERSGLGELLGVDFETVGAMQLYRASDALVKHREAIEAHLFDRAMGLFDLQPTVTLYDLTNTYFEGEADEQPQAQRGHSKEKRSDCPLLTLGLMLDASGFVRRSKVFAGNVREQRTLAGMLEALEAPPGALVVMDRGVATEACVQWLRDHDYRYLVVSRERHRQFDAEAAVSLQTRSNQTVHMHKVVSTDPDEVRLYCYSEERAEKERGIVERFATRFETALTELHEGLARPRAHKRLNQVWQRIGRLKTKHSRVASHYQIGVTADETGEKAVAVTWTRRPRDGSMATHPGVYCLRSSESRVGRRRPVAHLHHPHRRRGRLPLAQVRARPAPHLPSQAAAGRRPPVHHRHRLPARPGHPHPTARSRQPRQLDPRSAASWTASNASPPPSAARTGARSTCARPRKPNPRSGTSTRRSASTRTPGAFARPSSDRPNSPVCARL